MLKHLKGHETWLFRWSHNFEVVHMQSGAKRFPFSLTVHVFSPSPEAEAASQKGFLFRNHTDVTEVFLFFFLVFFLAKEIFCEASKSTRNFSFFFFLRWWMTKMLEQRKRELCTRQQQWKQKCAAEDQTRGEKKENAERPKKPKVNSTSERKQGRARVTFITSIERINITWNIHFLLLSLFLFFPVNA